MSRGTGKAIVPGSQSEDGGATTVLQAYTNQAKHVQTESGSTNAYGNHPNTLSLTTSGSAAATDNVLLFTAENLEPYNVHMIQASDGAVDVEVSLDGTTYSPAGAFAMEDTTQTASATRTVTTSSTNVYIIRGKYSAIRVRNTAAATATAVMLSGVE